MTSLTPPLSGSPLKSCPNANQQSVIKIKLNPANAQAMDTGFVS